MNLCQNIIQIKQLITQAEKDSNRPPGRVLLLAVSKQQSVEAIREAYTHGITHFGENYVQEALQKIDQLKTHPIYWHFIGPIQSNKTKAIATHFDWVHSINRAKIGHALNKNRLPHQKPLQVCLQINLVHEESKAGIPPDQATQLALIVSQLPHLKLRGLMTIPPPQHDNYELFLQLKELMQSLNQKLNLNMDTLSMGMSDDIVPAIRAGSTILRIGRALFGERL